MLDRIVGALTFRKGVYAEVERDKSFYQSAWLIVIVVALLNSLGYVAGVVHTEGFFSWIIASVVNAIFAILGFAVSAFIISWVGKTVFSAKVDFNEMVRVLGLAYIWRIIGFIGILASVSVALSCVLAPVTFAAAILGLVAWLLAVKEALDLDWLKTIITIALGWIAGLIVTVLSSLVLGLIGISITGVTSLF